MSQEIQGIVCQIDPQQKTFQEAVNDWVSGKISYEQVMEKYPNYLLHPAEKAVRFIGRAAKTLLGKLKGPQN
jgi:hypothetical protein